MSNSLGWKAALLSFVLLAGAYAASARAGGTSGSVSVRPVAQRNAVNSPAQPARILAILANPMFMQDGDGDRDDKDNDHAPTPEPSTLLSFGAALLIGGGVLFSRRLRRNGK